MSDESTPIDARTGPTASAESEDTNKSRRNALRALGLAAGGAAAGLVATSPEASANDPDDLTLGQSKGTASVTQADFVGTGSGVGFLFQSGSTYQASFASYQAALAGWASDNTPGPQIHGVYGYSGIIGSGGAGVVGWGYDGPGVVARGGRCAVRLVPSDALGDAHEAGDLIEDLNHDLWLCTSSGTPGTLRKLAGPATAGAFHPITPIRVYDSRLPAPTPGALAAGTSRVVSVAASRNQSTGAVLTANAVPAGATAVVGNLTIVEMTGSGYLSLMPGNAASLVGSSINWTPTTGVLANGFTAKLDTNRQLKVFASVGSTHFIIDINGYYL